jgi:undecaprenyl-phosphate 4-deoxy-4-formamido-L-arabinose transferase
MATDKKISVVVPVYKSQECVKVLLERIDESLRNSDYELILVNDCSPDDSWEEIRKATQLNPRVIGINLRKNSGQDSALMAGFSIVTGDYVVIMDDDLQHDPRDIKKLIQGLEERDFDVCFGLFDAKKQKLWKNLGSWFNGKMAEIVINKPRKIYLSPFKVIKREVVDEIVKYGGPYPYVDGLIFTVTENVTQIRVEHHNRFAGKTNYNLTRSLSVWAKLITNFSVFPLRIATVLGLLTATLGFLLAVFIFFRYFLAGERVEGWTSLMVVVLGVGGMILLAVGGIGEYVGRSYIRLNRRPQYCIKEKVNAGE